MPEVVLYIAASLDGYIARSDGAVDWLDDLPEPGDGPDGDYGYGEFFASVGAVLMGRITYEQVLSFDVDYPYPGTDGYVFSRSRAGQRDDNVQFVEFVDGTDMAAFVGRLKAAGKGNIWLVGGGQLVREFLCLDLIDRFELFILPIVLGEGIPMFPPPSPEMKLDLAGCRSYGNGMVWLTYRRGAQG